MPGATGVNKANLAAKLGLASLKAKIDKINVYKPKIVSVYLSKRCNVVDNNVLKKFLYDHLVTKFNAIDNTVFVLKTQYKTNKSGLEKKLMLKIRKHLTLVESLKRQIIMIRSLILKVKYLALLALLLLPLLMKLKKTYVKLTTQKHIITPKYQTLRLNIILFVIIMSFTGEILDAREKRKQVSW